MPFDFSSALELHQPPPFLSPLRSGHSEKFLVPPRPPPPTPPHGFFSPPPPFPPFFCFSTRNVNLIENFFPLSSPWQEKCFELSHFMSFPIVNCFFLFDLQFSVTPMLALLRWALYGIFTLPPFLFSRQYHTSNFFFPCHFPPLFPPPPCPHTVRKSFPTAPNQPRRCELFGVQNFFLVWVGESFPLPFFFFFWFFSFLTPPRCVQFNILFFTCRFIFLKVSPLSHMMKKFIYFSNFLDTPLFSRKVFFPHPLWRLVASFFCPTPFLILLALFSFFPPTFAIEVPLPFSFSSPFYLL